MAPVRQLDLPIFTPGTGRVEPFNSVLVKSRVDGPIVRVRFVEGDAVKRGDPLFEIDPRFYKAIVVQAEGQLARDQAQLASAKTDFDRLRVLVRDGLASVQAFDQNSSRVAELSAAIRTDQGVLDNARLNLDLTTIRAPIAGRVGKRLVDVGNLVHSVDGTPLVQIVQMQPVAVILTVPQSALPEIRAHQKLGPPTVQIMAPDNENVMAEGKLTLVGNAIDPQTGTIELKAVFNNSDGMLWPGQLVSGRVITSLRERALAVPSAAVQPGSKGKFVYVVNEKMIVSARDVKLGPHVSGLTVIEEGVAAGETVVTDGHDQLAPGMAVRVDGQENSQAIQRPRKSVKQPL